MLDSWTGAWYVTGLKILAVVIKSNTLLWNVFKQHLTSLNPICARYSSTYSQCMNLLDPLTTNPQRGVVSLSSCCRGGNLGTERCPTTSWWQGHASNPALLTTPLAALNTGLLSPRRRAGGFIQFQNTQITGKASSTVGPKRRWPKGPCPVSGPLAPYTRRHGS